MPENGAKPMDAKRMNSLQRHGISVHLDIPLSPKEAKKRGICQKVSRLLIEADSEIFARIILNSCPKNKTVFINAVGSFLSTDKLSAALAGKGIEIIQDIEFVSAKNKESINNVFSRWKAEVLVAFIADRNIAKNIFASLNRLQPKWWKYTNEGYESPYLRQLKLADPFFFYSPTLSVLEVFGNKTSVMDCFRHTEKILLARRK